MRHITIATGIVLLLSVSAKILATELPLSDRLPSTLARGGGALPETPSRGWTLRDIVEISAITGVAVALEPRQIGFVIRQPALDAGTIAYGLYAMEVNGSSPARKILEAPYIAQLSRDPSGQAWTVLADLGAGVQVYNIDDHGVSTPIVVNAETVIIGTYDGVIPSLHEPHASGIISYQWSPDGTSLWYSRPRLRSPAELLSFVDRGIRFDDLTMHPVFNRQHTGKLLGAELHLVKRSPSSDRTLAFAPSNASSNIDLLQRDFGNVNWDSDSRHILYGYFTLAEDGKEIRRQYSVDVVSGKSEPLSQNLKFPNMVSSADGNHYLTLSRSPKGESHLAEYTKEGTQITEGAPVTINYMGDYDGMGSWRDPIANSVIFAVGDAARTGLTQIPETVASRAWSAVTDRIRYCSFSKDLGFGACVRDNLTLAPELVLVDTDSGAFKTLARPNARYDGIWPLRSEHVIWKNRYGQENDGYITYPRSFNASLRFPAIVVTHAGGALNEFVERGFQAEIPVQVLAETGYLVLSVNEPTSSLRMRGGLTLRGMAAARANIARTQFAVIASPVASMEAALQDAIRRGLADPNKTGIAGYSRGAEVSTYAMTQSKMFRAASIGDGASAVNADGYWSWGTRGAVAWNTAIYGGSPYDSKPQVRNSYKRYSPAFRSDVFAGPLLEQCPANLYQYGLERSTLLRETGIPTELDFYLNESHVLWHPQHMAASMQRTLDWFDFWLLGKIDPDPSKSEQYTRWQAMAAIYEARHPLAATVPGGNPRANP